MVYKWLLVAGASSLGICPGRSVVGSPLDLTSTYKPGTKMAQETGLCGIFKKQ